MNSFSFMSFGVWDALLIGVVSVMGTAIAYLRHPEHKAFVLMLPVPFTLAMLALGRGVDASNVLGLCLLFLFAFGVWALHGRMGAPIVPSIAVAATAYGLGASFISRKLPAGDAAFWGAVAFTLGAGAWLVWRLPYRQEPHHRTPLPVWVKVLAIALATTGVVALKHQLGGFMTTFPMVGVVAAYESRHSLWTIVRRIPWLMLLMTLMMVVCRLTQERFGLAAALALSWPVLLAGLFLLRRKSVTIQESEARSLSACGGPVFRMKNRDLSAYGGLTRLRRDQDRKT